MGLDPRTPGSWPEAKADAQPLSHPGAQESLRFFQPGIPGWRSGSAPAFGPGRDPGDRDRIPHRAPGAWSLLLPLPVTLPLSVCLS